MALPLGSSPRVARDFRQFGQSPLSQPFQGGSAAVMAQAGKYFYLNSLCIYKRLCLDRIMSNQTILWFGLTQTFYFDYELFMHRTHKYSSDTKVYNIFNFETLLVLY